MCQAVMASRSAAMRAGRRSPMGCDRKPFDEPAQRQLVAVGAESANHRHRRVCQGRAATLRLARVDVGEMHFDEWNLHTRQRVANGEAGMAVRARVHQRAVGASAQRVHSVDDLTFAVVLRERDLDTELLGDGQEIFLDVGKGLVPVKLGLAYAEEIEIGPIDDGDFHSPVSPSSQARNFATSSSDSCACGRRGFTRGVGVGGVGGVLVVAPGAPLNAPASLDAARLSAGSTEAPAKTASREGGGPDGGSGAGAGSGGATCAARIWGPPPEAAARGGRFLPSVAKNSLIDG